AVLGVEAVTWDRHQAPDETVERVAPHKQAHALALAEPYEPHRDREQVLVPNLQQGVAGIGLEDLDQRFGVMAGRWVTRPFQHRLDLLLQQRDLERAR